MPAIEVVTNNLMVLGGGLMQREPEAPFELRTTARVDCAGQYFQEHSELFLDEELGVDPMILCAGGGSAIYDNAEQTRGGVSEGGLSAGRLIVKWGVPPEIVKTATRSRTTTMNVVESVESGLLVPEKYSAVHPLGVATHPNNFWRAKADFRDAGFRKGSLIGIHPKGRDPAVSDALAKEVVSRMVRAAYFRGVQRGELAEMRVRNDRLETAITQGMQGILRGVASAAQNRRRR